jgi:hypothetical protein
MVTSLSLSGDRLYRSTARTGFGRGFIMPIVYVHGVANRKNDPSYRQPRALVVALRRIAKDPKATVGQWLRACELLAPIAGFIEVRTASDRRVEPRAALSPARAANLNRLRMLLETSRDEKSTERSPDASASSLRQ